MASCRATTSGRESRRERVNVPPEARRRLRLPGTWQQRGPRTRHGWGNQANLEWFSRSPLVPRRGRCGGCRGHRGACRRRPRRLVGARTCSRPGCCGSAFDERGARAEYRRHTSRRANHVGVRATSDDRGADEPEYRTGRCDCRSHRLLTNDPGRLIRGDIHADACRRDGRHVEGLHHHALAPALPRYPYASRGRRVRRHHRPEPIDRHQVDTQHLAVRVLAPWQIRAASFGALPTTVRSSSVPEMPASGMTPSPSV